MSRSHPDAFLLGAGFARALSPRMPLLQDLADRVCERLGKNAVLPDAVAGMMRENFAHALSYLEQSKPWLTESENLRHRALFLEMSNAIARVLDETAAEIRHDPASSRHPWLTNLIRHWHERRSTVLTLNYDTLIERIVSTVDLGQDRRISSGDLYPRVLTDARLRFGSAPPAHRERTFTLLKLHGSTNWYYSGRTATSGEPIYFVPPIGADEDEAAQRDHDLRLRAVADKYPFLVPPVYDKSPLLTHETIRALWFEAGETLKRARHLVCLGYSLPTSDLTMMHFLRATLSPGARVELVNQDRQSVSNFERLLQGAEIEIVQASSGENCISEFVQRHF